MGHPVCPSTVSVNKFRYLYICNQFIKFIYHLSNSHLFNLVINPSFKFEMLSISFMIKLFLTSILYSRSSSACCLFFYGPWRQKHGPNLQVLSTLCFQAHIYSLNAIIKIHSAYQYFGQIWRQIILKKTILGFRWDEHMRYQWHNRRERDRERARERGREREQERER